MYLCLTWIGDKLLIKKKKTVKASDSVTVMLWGVFIYFACMDWFYFVLSKGESS